MTFATAASYEFLGEPIFIPRKEASKSCAEDDGYLAGVMVDTKDMKSFFTVFDAKNVEKGPISKLLLPTYVPYGLHGYFADGLTQDFDDITRRFKVRQPYSLIHFTKLTFFVKGN